MGVNVFIDGQAGTTGLRILDRFANRNDITLLQIDPEKRKDAAERKRLINSSDYTFLCLPDAAAREAAIKHAINCFFIIINDPPFNHQLVFLSPL